MSPRFEPSVLAQLREDDEIEIETWAGEDKPAHRTVIWVVVDDQDRVLIRTFRGPGARWYREISAQPECRLHVRRRALAGRAISAIDADRVAACSEGLRTKYAGHAATGSMVRLYVETTLELVPPEAQPRPVEERTRSGSITKISRSMSRIM